MAALAGLLASQASEIVQTPEIRQLQSASCLSTKNEDEGNALELLVSEGRIPTCPSHMACWIGRTESRKKNMTRWKEKSGICMQLDVPHKRPMFRWNWGFSIEHFLSRPVWSCVIEMPLSGQNDLPCGTDIRC